MRIDAEITFKIEDNKNSTRAVVHINDASPASVLDVVVNVFHSGMWTGPSAGSGTFYPARRLCSAAVVYRTHCGHDTCTEPFGKAHETHSAAVLDTNIKHTHTLPKPKPEPKGKTEPKPKPKPKR